MYINLKITKFTAYVVVKYRLKQKSYNKMEKIEVN